MEGRAAVWECSAALCSRERARYNTGRRTEEEGGREREWLVAGGSGMDNKLGKGGADGGEKELRIS